MVSDLERGFKYSSILMPEFFVVSEDCPILVLESEQPLSESIPLIKNIFNCVPKMNEGLTGFLTT